MVEVPKILKRQKALITGANSGIGKGCAISLAEHGADVAINFRKAPETAEAVAEECRKHGVEAIIVQADVSQEDNAIGPGAIQTPTMTIISSETMIVLRVETRSIR